jgi:hypothetical protein
MDGMPKAADRRQTVIAPWVPPVALVACFTLLTICLNAGWGGEDLRPRPTVSTDPTDPFPMPPELVDVKLMEQTAEDVRLKSAGCITCHANVGDPHGKDTVRLGCTDCHGGDPCATDKNLAHVRPRLPHPRPT